MVGPTTTHSMSPCGAILCGLLFLIALAPTLFADQKTPADPLANTNTSPVAARPAANTLPQTPPTSSDPATGSTLEQRKVLSSPTKQPVDSQSHEKTGDSDLPAHNLWRTMGSLILVLALIVLATWWLKRTAGPNRRLGKNSQIEILARTPLAPKQSLCLVKLDRRILLLGLSPNHIASLAVIDDPQDVANLIGHIESGSPQSISKTFASLIDKETRAYDTDELDTLEQEHQTLTQLDEIDDTQPSQQARGELASLLEKVKGLSRLHYRG